MAPGSTLIESTMPSPSRSDADIASLADSSSTSSRLMPRPDSAAKSVSSALKILDRYGHKDTAAAIRRTWADT